MVHGVHSYGKSGGGSDGNVARQKRKRRRNTGIGSNDKNLNTIIHAVDHNDKMMHPRKQSLQQQQRRQQEEQQEIQSQIDQKKRQLHHFDNLIEDEIYYYSVTNLSNFNTAPHSAPHSTFNPPPTPSLADTSLIFGDRSLPTEKTIVAGECIAEQSGPFGEAFYGSAFGNSTLVEYEMRITTVDGITKDLMNSFILPDLARYIMEFLLPAFFEEECTLNGKKEVRRSLVDDIFGETSNEPDDSTIQRGYYSNDGYDNMLATRLAKMLLGDSDTVMVDMPTHNIAASLKEEIGPEYNLDDNNDYENGNDDRIANKTRNYYENGNDDEIVSKRRLSFTRSSYVIPGNETKGIAVGRHHVTKNCTRGKNVNPTCFVVKGDVRIYTLGWAGEDIFTRGKQEIEGMTIRSQNFSETYFQDINIDSIKFFNPFGWPWLWIGLGIAAGVLLASIIVVVCCICRRKRE